VKLRRKAGWMTLLTALLVCGAVILCRRVSEEPRFEGRTVNGWLRSPDFENQRWRVEFAVVSVGGQRAIPPLRRALLSSSRFARLAYRWTPGALGRRIWGRDWCLYTLRERALCLLETMGAEVRPATPELVYMAKDRTEFPDLRRRAISLLTRSCSDPGQLIPVLEALVNDPVPEVRQAAGIDLFNLRQHKNDAARREALAILETHQAARASNASASGLEWKADVSLIQDFKRVR
jgi:HEAT repeat protein